MSSLFPIKRNRIIDASFAYRRQFSSTALILDQLIEMHIAEYPLKGRIFKTPIKPDTFWAQNNAFGNHDPTHRSCMMYDLFPGFTDVTAGARWNAFWETTSRAKDPYIETFKDVLSASDSPIHLNERDFKFTLRWEKRAHVTLSEFKLLNYKLEK